MATLEQQIPVTEAPTQATSEVQAVMQIALGRQMAEEEAMMLGYDLLEFLDALTGEDDDSGESS